MPKKKEEELVGKPTVTAAGVYDPKICHDCEINPPDYLISSWRIQDRPICSECAVPYAMSFLYTIRKVS